MALDCRPDVIVRKKKVCPDQLKVDNSGYNRVRRRWTTPGIEYVIEKNDTFKMVTGGVLCIIRKKSARRSTLVRDSWKCEMKIHSESRQITPAALVDV